MDSDAIRRVHDAATFPIFLRGKRILVCTESLGPINGVSNTTLQVVQRLRQGGAHVCVVAPHHKEPAGEPRSHERQQEARLMGVRIPFSPDLCMVLPVRLSTIYARTFGGPPDVIYLGSPASLGCQIMLQMRQIPRLEQVPIMCNFQTDLSGYSRILFPICFSHVAAWMIDSLQSFLFRHESVRTICYPSIFVLKYLTTIGVHRYKMRILQRGVDTQLFHPSRCCAGLRDEVARRDQVVLICVARLAGEKGFDFLAQAAKELDARGLDFVLLVVGGNKNPAIEDEVKAGFAPLIDKGRVVFMGYRVGEELAMAYATADIFLHCSVTETFGLVVLESLASGVPVIARDEGGPSDIIVDGMSGLLVRPDDLDAFVTKVIFLSTHVHLRDLMSVNARRQAERATWRKVTNQVAWHLVDMMKVARDDSSVLRNEMKAKRLAASWPQSTQTWQRFEALVSMCWVQVRMAFAMMIITSSWVVIGVYLVLELH